MLALRHVDGSEQVLVLTDLLTGRTYGIDEAELSEPVREWIRRKTERPGSRWIAEGQASAQEK